MGLSRRQALGMTALLCGAVCMGVGIGSVAHEAATARSYADLALSTKTRRQATSVTSGRDTADATDAPLHDWQALREANPSVAAWVSVGGTGIDLPVVQTRDPEEESWYLSHDLWGSSSASGTPFLDWRCGGAQARHACAYAHHMTSSDAMFSQLQGAYGQEEFDALGRLTWETPEALVRAEPLCALRVDASWQDIQRFDWGRPSETNDAFRSWLAGIAAQATARSPEGDALVTRSSRCVTLVTCSSDLARQRWRTLALWVA